MTGYLHGITFFKAKQMKTFYTQDDVVASIRQRTDASSIAAVAREMGFSRAYLWNVLNGTKDVSEEVAAHFGFRRETEIRFLKAS